MNSVLLATIGWVVVNRTLRIVGEHQMIRQLKRRREHLIQINFVLLCALLGPDRPLFALSIIGIILISPLFVSITKSRVNEQRFHNETVDLYDSLLMDVRGGLSVREAILNSGQSPQWSYPHRETVAYVVKNSAEIFPNRHKAMQLRAREITSILSSGSRVTDRLKFYRDQWSLVIRLDRKIKSATQPTRAQAFVVVVLYILVATYQAVQDAHFLTSKWFLTGTFLMVLGLLMIWRIQRTFRWKI